MSFNSIMAFPDDPKSQLPGTPRRATVRHSLCRKVELRYEGTESFVTLLTINISRRGMLVATPDPPPVGCGVELRLPLADGTVLELTGTVVRVVHAPGGHETGAAGAQLGISLDPTPEQQAQLDQYLAATIGTEVDGLPDFSDEMPWEARGLAPEPPKATLGRIQLKRVVAAERAAAERGAGGASHRRASPDSKDPVVGIDFGTTACRVGVLVGDRLEMVRDEAGRSAIPTVVWYKDAGTAVVGHEARERLPLEPVRTIQGIQRLFGCRKITRDAAEYLRSIACPARSIAGRGLVFDINDEEMTPVDIAAAVLRHVREQAERSLGRPVRKVVLAHPLAFNEDALADLEAAARLAGLEPLSLIPEPVAVALAYGYGDRSGVVGVYDLGGGSFSFTVLECGDVPAVLSALSDPWLGGDAMDLAVARAGAEEFYRVTQVDLRQRVVEWRRVVQAAEEAKLLLSSLDEVELSVPGVVLTSRGEIDLCVPLTRRRFDELTTELVYKTMRLGQRALGDAVVPKDQLDALLLAGGATRVPAVRATAEVVYGREPDRAAFPERAAALGATLVAAGLLGRPAPASPCAALVADEVVGSTIGLAMAGGITEPLIRRATPVPVAVRRVFATFRDGQTRLEVRIVVGEERQTAGNRVVGAVEVTDLPAGPAGSAEVEIKFEVSSPDKLSVRTRDLSSSRHRWTHFQLPS
jgi:molecular chaperone DnaK